MFVLDVVELVLPPLPPLLELLSSTEVPGTSCIWASAGVAEQHTATTSSTEGREREWIMEPPFRGRTGGFNNARRRSDGQLSSDATAVLSVVVWPIHTSSYTGFSAPAFNSNNATRS